MAEEFTNRTLSESLASQLESIDQAENKVRALPNDLNAIETFELKQCCLRLCRLNRELIQAIGTQPKPPGLLQQFGNWIFPPLPPDE